MKTPKAADSIKLSLGDAILQELQGHKRSGLVVRSLWFLLSLWFFGSMTNLLMDDVWKVNTKVTLYTNGTYVGPSRTKRFIKMTSDRRLNLPKGAKFKADQTVSLPGYSPLPTGYGSETAIGIPFRVSFDDLGWTSEENTFAQIPLLTSTLDIFKPLTDFFSQSYLAIEDFLSSYRLINFVDEPQNTERSMMFQVVEDTLHNLGINGKACLLRTICEVHKDPIFGHGLVGELMQLFMTVSNDQGTDKNELEEYLSAELRGKQDGDCFPYHQNCPLSIFNALSPEEHQHENKIRQQFFEEKIHRRQNIKKLELKISKLKKYHKKKLKLQKTLKKEYFAAKKNRTVKHLSREKRLIYFGPHKKIKFPRGTLYIVKPEVGLPFMSNLPTGLSSGLAVGVAFKCYFDDLGYSSSLNPFLKIRTKEEKYAKEKHRHKRDTWTPLPGVNYEGGDREVLYYIAENTIERLSLDGRQCLLRAICEWHLAPLSGYGLIGEIIHMLLSPSKALHAELRLEEYLEAESVGSSSGSCSRYQDGCPVSVFASINQWERWDSEKYQNLLNAIDTNFIE